MNASPQCPRDKGSFAACLQHCHDVIFSNLHALLKSISKQVLRGSENNLQENVAGNKDWMTTCGINLCYNTL